MVQLDWATPIERVRGTDDESSRHCCMGRPQQNSVS